MRTLNAITEEDIAHNEKVDVAAVGWDNDKRTIILVMSFYLRNRVLIDHNSLINRSEQFGQEPSK